MKAMKRAGTIVISVILWAIILLAALYAFTTMATKDDQNVASILGYTPLVVETDSMKPTFESGDLIFICWLYWRLPISYCCGWVLDPQPNSLLHQPIAQ